MKHSILIMMFGQSNADAHNAGPCILSPYLDNPAVVVPNDGRGFQGLRGLDRAKPITGFVPSYDPKCKIQSIGAAAGASLMSNTTGNNLGRTIVRSAARGGRPMHGHFSQDRHLEGIHLDGHGKRSYLFESFVEDVRQMQIAAAADGMPIKHIYIPFFHGEADRSMDRHLYQAHLETLMDEIDAEMAALDLGTDWLLTQPSGTGLGYNGNGWGNRLCLMDIANARKNAHLAAANYGYALHDNVHLSANSKGLIGEFLGHQIAALEAGHKITTTQVSDIAITGNIVDIYFKGPHKLILDETRFPAPDTPLGFRINRQKEQSISRVTQTGDRAVRLTCAIPLDGDKTSIDYAFMGVKSDRSVKDFIPYAIGRGCLREDWSKPSKIFLGTDLLNWVPGFSIALADVAHDQIAA